MSAIRLTVTNVYHTIAVRAMTATRHTVRIATMAKNIVSSGVKNANHSTALSVKLRV